MPRAGPVRRAWFELPAAPYLLDESGPQVPEVRDVVPARHVAVGVLRPAEAGEPAGQPADRGREVVGEGAGYARLQMDVRRQDPLHRGQRRGEVALGAVRLVHRAVQMEGQAQVRIRPAQGQQAAEGGLAGRAGREDRQRQVPLQDAVVEHAVREVEQPLGGRRALHGAQTVEARALEVRAPHPDTERLSVRGENDGLGTTAVPVPACPRLICHEQGL